MDHKLSSTTNDARRTSRLGNKATSGRTSNDMEWGNGVLPSPSPTETTSIMASSAAASSHSSQASPFSSVADPYGDVRCPRDKSHSMSSSYTESWTNGASTDAEEAEHDMMSDEYEHSSDADSFIPKLEPLEDEVLLDNLNAAPLTPSEPSVALKVPKRSRGRPRKHPIAPISNGSKVTKGRSKTGCITCRKRKKKCDETKPRCLNCEKNAVVCEGYQENQIWRSGREKAEEERIRNESASSASLPPIFHGIETVEDKIFLRYYISHLSNVFTMEDEPSGALKQIILPLAARHQGLMHSILAVSSAHLDLDAPYGRSILTENPSITLETLQNRSSHHKTEALSRLRKELSTSPDDPEHHTILAARYSVMLCHLLQIRAEGSKDGSHKIHLEAYRNYPLQDCPPEDAAFHAFVTELFQYHIYAYDLLWHPDSGSPRLVTDEMLKHNEGLPASRLIGVNDGLFNYLAQINTMRNSVRERCSAGIEPLVPYEILYKAMMLYDHLCDSSSETCQGDSRANAISLYKWTLWVYLHRTLYPILPNSKCQSRSNFYSEYNTAQFRGRNHLDTQPPTLISSQHEQRPLPTRRASVASIIQDDAAANTVPVHIGPPTRSSSMHEEDTRGPPSPPPSRRPSQDDQRFVRTLSEALEKLQKFEPSDPAQTVLLMPCLILGTSCLEPSQHDQIRAAVRTVRTYTGLKSCDCVMELLEEIWSLMARGHWEAAWDWQGTARRMGLDFLCA